MSQSEYDQSVGLNELLCFYEFLAEENEWRYERVNNNLVLMVIEGNWRIYTLSVSVNQQNKIMQLTCSFDLNPRKNREKKLYQIINRINHRTPSGTFFVCDEFEQCVFRDQIPLIAMPQIKWKNLSGLLNYAVNSCDQYFPALQLVNYGEDNIDLALAMAITEVMGTA